MGRTALILGAGLGGISAAQALRKALPHNDRVVLVDRGGEHVYPAPLPWVLAGSRSIPQISRPMEHAARRGIAFVRGEVTAISPAERSATIDGRALRADALIIALGAQYNPDAVPGLAEAGHCFYTPQGAVSGQRALGAFQGGGIAFLTAPRRSTSARRPPTRRRCSSTANCAGGVCARQPRSSSTLPSPGR